MHGLLHDLRPFPLASQCFEIPFIPLVRVIWGLVVVADVEEQRSGGVAQDVDDLRKS